MRRSVNAKAYPLPPSTEMTDVSAVVLAGGASRRMGRDKRALPWDQDAAGQARTLLQSIVSRVHAFSSDVIVVANDELDATPARVVPDAFPDSGSLGGIYSGLAAAAQDAAFVCAADMPFLNPELAVRLIDRLGGSDAVVPVVDGRPEPLHAVYRRTLLDPMRERIGTRQLKISPLFDAANVTWIEEAELRTIDPELASFRNINTPAEYAAALAILEGA